ncbi:MAG: hypothetical protein LIP08_16000 [Bacteroides sp.]|nr:hypothetical protein [Bacteroides sp.]
MKKISLNFLNRFERFIVKSHEDAYVPVSASIASGVLAAAVVGIVLVFLLQMFNADSSLGVAVLGTAFGAVLLYAAYKVYKAMAYLPTTGAKLKLAAYALVLYGITAFVFFYLVMWALIIVLMVGVCLLILKYALGSSGGKRGRVYYSDGTSEEVVEDGTGICGETYYKSESGRTHVEP